MSWRRISMKFPGTCVVCGQKIEVNEFGLWAKGVGVKHEKCAETKELQCIVCGKSAGCSACEFREDCDLEKVSQICICKKCSEDSESFNNYLKSVKRKFRILNS